MTFAWKNIRNPLHSVTECLPDDTNWHYHYNDHCSNNPKDDSSNQRDSCKDNNRHICQKLLKVKWNLDWWMYHINWKPVHDTEPKVLNVADKFSIWSKFLVVNSSKKCAFYRRSVISLWHHQTKYFAFIQSIKYLTRVCLTYALSIFPSVKTRAGWGI